MEKQYCYLFHTNTILLKTIDGKKSYPEHGCFAHKCLAEGCPTYLLLTWWREGGSNRRQLALQDTLLTTIPRWPCSNNCQLYWSGEEEGQVKPIFQRQFLYTIVCSKISSLHLYLNYIFKNKQLKNLIIKPYFWGKY